MEFLKEELEGKANNEEQALDFFAAKQVLLSSYFQSMNLLILKRLNGIQSDFLTESPKRELMEEFGIGESKEIWGNER